MPRIRLLADNARSQASGASGQDHAGNYVFEAGRGELVAVNIEVPLFRFSRLAGVTAFLLCIERAKHSERGKWPASRGQVSGG